LAELEAPRSEKQPECIYISRMPKILLTTINARYIHASLGLRYLYANLGELQAHCELREFENSQTAHEIAESVINTAAEIVGFGVYIWNVARTREVVTILRKIKPDTIIVLGGPEVSYDYHDQPVVQLADYLITGEADLAFADLCRAILNGAKPADKVIHSGLPDLKNIALPYKLYRDTDIASRVIYVEVSRGCPFTCEFCLSSIDLPVRQFDHLAVLSELDQLYKRGARSFKFVDRTFNLNLRIASDILQFFLDRIEPGLFVHFEMVPDRFPQKLREIVSLFPLGALQLEIGVQSLNPRVGELISRRQDITKLLENLKFLRTETSAYLHVDLIVGLPGEDLDSFASGFDRLVEVNPQEIQVGILKRLKGTPIIRHDTEYRMVYSDEPPYEVLATRDVSFLDLRRMTRFARYWDLVGNSGNFALSRALIWETTTPFVGFMEWSDWLFEQVARSSSIELKSLTSLLFRFLTQVRGLNHDRVGQSLAADYMRGGRSDLPGELREYAGDLAGAPAGKSPAGKGFGGKRQARVVGSR
jgi:radical SAM superfamily enzyme YgiQ (UPF0313 family)